MNVLFSAWIKYFSSLWKTIEYCFLNCMHTDYATGSDEHHAFVIKRLVAEV